MVAPQALRDTARTIWGVPRIIRGGPQIGRAASHLDGGSPRFVQWGSRLACEGLGSIRAGPRLIRPPRRLVPIPGSSGEAARRWATPRAAFARLGRPGPYGYHVRMVAFKGQFDGRVIVPSGPVSLPRGRELLFQVEVEDLRLGDAADLLGLAGALDEQTVAEMEAAIQSECERINDEW